MRRRDVIFRKGVAFILSFALVGGGVNLPVMTAMAAEAGIETSVEGDIVDEQEEQEDEETPAASEEDTESEKESETDSEVETPDEETGAEEEKEADSENPAIPEEATEAGEGIVEDSEVSEAPEVEVTESVEESETNPEIPEITEEVTASEEESETDSETPEITEEATEKEQEETATAESTTVTPDSSEVTKPVMKPVQKAPAVTQEESVLEEEQAEEEPIAEPNSDIELYSVIDDVLKEDAAKYISAELKTKIEAVAAGSETSTSFSIDIGDPELAKWLLEEDANGKLVNLLTPALAAINDIPYDLFWNEKNAVQVRVSGTTAVFSFQVAKKYQGKDAYTVNADMVKQSKAAESTAKNIISTNGSKNDKDKLKAYMQEICNLTSYNHTALSQKDDPNRETDAWQAVNVFAKKQVVCEGYSKAFRYLCDKSEFSSSVDCYNVSGNMQGSGNIVGAGDHMWNLVVIGDKSYLVDVTNCDSLGSDALFLATPTSGSVENGYVFKFDGGSITYKYDQQTLDLFGKDNPILKLATSSSGTSSTQKPTTPTTKPTRPTTKPTTKPSTSVNRPTTSRPSTSVNRPTTSRPSTSVNRPTTSKPSTSVNRPTTSRPSTSVNRPTTNRPTTSKPSTSVNRPTTSRPSTSVNRPTTNRPTTSKPSTSVNRPTTSRPSTSVNRPTTNRPTTSKPSTSVNRPTTSRPSTSVNRPTTSRPSTSVNRPTTSRPSTSVNRPTTSRPSTSVNRPTTSRPSTSVNRPTTSRPSTSVSRPSSSRTSTSKRPSLTLPRVSGRSTTLALNLNQD